jgi:hypothetical protein
MRPVTFQLKTYFDKIHSRWPISDTVNSQDWLAVGCSHTAGYGVERNEIYISQLSQHYDRPIHNAALGTANHAICRHNIELWLEKYGRPELIIIQWPNPIRRTIWHDNQGNMCTVSQATDMLFQTMVKAGENNFYVDWIASVLAANQLCKYLGIHVVNVLLENVDSIYYDILHSRGVILHADEKLPGKSWTFDNAGSDNQHHSAQCHQLWTKRMIGIIDELTTR